MTRVFALAPTPVMQAGLRAALEEAGADLGLRVIGVWSGIGSPDLAEADVVVVAEEELLEEAAEAISGDGTQALVLISTDDHPAARLRAMPLSGWGIVAPYAPPEELAAAVVAASRGLVALTGPLADRLLREPVEEGGLDEPLTSREREVLELLARGLSNRLIADELYISEHTVKFHISSLYAKLGVSSRAEAVSAGARRGLISL